MVNRRNFLVATGVVALAPAAVASRADQRPATPGSSEPSDLPVRFSLNTSTIMGQGLTIQQQIDVAAEAGYDGIEPWIRDLQSYVEKGGRLTDLKKQIADAGLTVESAIGFAKWISDDDAIRKEALQEAQRDMQMIHAIGGTRIAAPPAGAPEKLSDCPSLDVIADRYRALLKVGAKVGVTPQLELWGHSKALSKLSQLAYIATAVEHPDACLLPDFYHIYKGGSKFTALKMIEASRMHCFHINDYPASLTPQDIGDKDRVFPGDGDCELEKIIRQLLEDGFRGAFSLELFNREYWKRDALAVATEGLGKCRAVVGAAVK